MKHPETQMVTADNGPRPAGPPDQCFYCQKPIGEPHAADCACPQRTVVVKATITYVIAVPDGWTAAEIERHRNSRCWCADNMFDELDRVHKVKGCMCGITQFEFVREATADEEVSSGLPSLIEFEKQDPEWREQLKKMEEHHKKLWQSGSFPLIDMFAEYYKEKGKP